jgi:hypothetical protein
MEDHQNAQWPSGSVPKQMHLELAVADLDEAEAAARAIGATKAILGHGVRGDEGFKAHLDGLVYERFLVSEGADLIA